MNRDSVIATIARQNPWWADPRARPALDARVTRTAGLDAYRRLTGSSKRHVLLIGPRQVGKTTVLLQVARRLLAAVEPASVCYLRLDDPDLKSVRLRALVDVYRDEFWSRNRLAYVLLDEIHESADWAKYIKSWFDGDEPLRVLATGSLAPHLVHGSWESGPGRWDELTMPPLDLFEFALLRGLLPDEPPPPSEEQWYERPTPHVPAAREAWSTYLLQGGFPAAALDNDLVTAHQRLREDTYNRVLVRDIAVHFGMRSFDKLHGLFRYVAEHSSGIANVAALGARIEASSPTVVAMLGMLRDTLLVGETLPYARGKAMLRPRPKLYVCDASLRSALLLYGPEHLDRADVAGPNWETAAYAHLARLAGAHGGELRYWRDARGEVDFVLTLGGQPPLPIEVTAGAGDGSKVGNLERCAKAVGAKRVLVLANDASPPERIGGRVELVRSALPDFLWTIGAAERARALREG